MEFASVDDYLAAVPEPARSALQSLRTVIRAAVPDATEHISYGMPSYKLGRPLVSFAAFTHHCSLFGMSSRVFDRLAAELQGWRTSKGTIRFTPDRPLPQALVRRIIAERLAEIALLDAERKTKNT
ncbi:DUF1801 domain-containing protein [Emcibacter sp. SYSU 3D8]|uniref:iron chaperone n=1 Tax=Emcibacter sp. SYSU 3D8 TaxID=3133969 RepID=UPI0031FE9321